MKVEILLICKSSSESFDIFSHFTWKCLLPYYITVFCSINLFILISRCFFIFQLDSAATITCMVETNVEKLKSWLIAFSMRMCNSLLGSDWIFDLKGLNRNCRKSRLMFLLSAVRLPSDSSVRGLPTFFQLYKMRIMIFLLDTL